MSGERSGAMEQAYGTNRDLSQQAYGIGLPLMQQQFGAINQQMQQGGQPGYIKAAYDLQRTMLQEGGANKSLLAAKAQAATSKGAVGGGNVMAGVTGFDLGASIADALTSSRVSQGAGAIDQMNNLRQMSLGGAGQVGSAAMGAAGQQIQGLSYLPDYNKTLAGVLGAGAGGLSVYGALQGQQQQQGFMGNDYSNLAGALGPQQFSMRLQGSDVSGTSRNRYGF
jgi:hypothetical protein